MESAKLPIKITQLQRDSLLQHTRLQPAIQERVASAKAGTQVIDFTKSELDHLQDEIGQATVYARSPHKQRLAATQKKIDNVLEKPALKDLGHKQLNRDGQPVSQSDRPIQLKISLRECRPTIWRRIQTKDCTLGVLHELIQTAMGWQNCHMHQFIVDGERYCAAMAINFDFGDEQKDVECSPKSDP